MSSIPAISECFRLMERFEMLPNIRQHSVIVARVALGIVDGLRENVISPPEIADRDLVIAGALLHDIAKTPCLKNGCDHANAGAEICHELGYHDIAEIVAEHVVLREHNEIHRQKGIFPAREIIYYADKRVRHEEIVSLDERLDYIIEHYGLGDPKLHERIRVNFARCVELEHCIFDFLPFAPDKMTDIVLDLQDDQLTGF